MSAQIEYSTLNPRWVFPSYYYTWTKPVDSRAIIQFVYIDTVMLAGNSDVHDPVTHELIRELDGSDLPGPSDQDLAETQLEWLAQTLAASEADYLIVAGHYPIYSASRHGPTPYLIDQVKPLLEKYRATAYLSGHDHCEQYLQERVGDVDHHTVGSASINDPKLTHKDDVPPGSLKYFSAATLGGFASVTVTHEGLSLTHHDGDGKVLYVAPPHAPRDTQWLSGAADRLREVVDRE
jgi:tartrate-resistant acid phosphatase type 5